MRQWNGLPMLAEVEPNSGLAAFVDVETTGLSPSEHEVIEMAAILFAFDWKSGHILGIVDEYCGLREPGRSIPSDARAVHGITLDMVKGTCLDSQRLESILGRAAFLVAHNAAFEKPFVERLFPVCKTKVWVCSMNGLPWRQEGFRSKGLQNLCSDYGIECEQAHRALSDARAGILLLCQKGFRASSCLGDLLATVLNPDEKMVFDAIRDTIPITGAPEIGYRKASSYVMIGPEKGACWFVRFKWGPRAKYMVVNPGGGTSAYQRFDLSQIDDIQQHADILRSAYAASLEWYETTRKYASAPRHMELIIDVGDVVRQALKEREKNDWKDQESRRQEAPARKHGCIGCLATGVTLLLSLAAIGSCLGRG